MQGINYLEMNKSTNNKNGVSNRRGCKRNSVRTDKQPTDDALSFETLFQ